MKTLRKQELYEALLKSERERWRAGKRYRKVQGIAGHCFVQLFFHCRFRDISVCKRLQTIVNG
jgi:hypothetical protein